MTRPTSLLADYLAPLIAYGLSLEKQLRRQKQPAVSSTEACRELLDRFQKAKAAAQQGGKRIQDIEESMFAIVAWLDELMARHPEWSHSSIPLETGLFGTTQGAEEFFNRLERLGAQQDEVREVYYCVLCLGFTGLQDHSELSRRKKALRGQLPYLLIAPSDLARKHLTPQPYLTSDPGPPYLPRAWNTWLLTTAAISAVLMVGFLLYPNVERATPPPETVAPTIDQAAIDTLLERLDCSRLSTVVDDRNMLTVTGYVARPEDEARLIEGLAKLAGVRGVSSQIELLGWPHCEAVELLTPFKDRNHAQALGLRVFVIRADTHFVEHEDLVVDVVAPNYDSYLYVDYYQSDGSVIHLYPGGADGDKAHVLKRSRYTIGQDNRRWKISGPFGQELIVAMASREPLFGFARSEIEKSKDYFAALREKLSDRTTKLTAAYLFITTGPR